MTLITPGLEEARTDELLRDVHNSLSDLRREFRALKERVEAGAVSYTHLTLPTKA